MMVARPVTPESGKPPPKPFATVMRSGATPECSIENILPVRAMPPCTSSAISTMPCSSHMRRSARRNSNGATLKPPSPCTGSIDDGGDRLRIDVAVEQAVEIGERLLGRDAAIGLREFGVIDLGRKRPEAPLVRHDLAGERHGHERAPVKAAGECDHRRPLGVVARDLDGVLHRLGAGRQEQGFFREIARGERVQPLGQPHVGFIGRHVKTGVRKGLRLLRDGGHDLRVTVTGVEHRDSGGEIDIAPAIDVPQLRIFGLDHIDALGADAVRPRPPLCGP